MKIITKVQARCLMISAAAVCLLFNVKVFANVNSPALSDVLRGKKPALDFGFVLFGFFALSLATLSFAKGCELLSRRRDSRKDKSKEENENLLKAIADSKNEKGELKAVINRLEEIIREKAGQEDILLKNNASLRRECEKLSNEKQKLEKESLEYKMNQGSLLDRQKEEPDAIEQTMIIEDIVPKQKIKVSVDKKKVKAKKAKTVKRKKIGGKRK